MNISFEQFIEYFENTWISDQCHFDRSLWNIYDQYSFRTNNISETYNHQINRQVIALNSKVYNILHVLRKQETLTANKFETKNTKFVHLLCCLSLSSRRSDLVFKWLDCQNSPIETDRSVGPLIRAQNRPEAKNAAHIELT